MDVREAQNKLLTLGFPLPRFGADGKWGSETRQAVLGYQASRALDLTGALDDKTVAALTKELPLLQRMDALEARMQILEEA